MLTIDSSGQERWRQKDTQESIQERRLRDLAHDLESNSISVCDDDGRDTSSLLAQMGRPMTSAQIIDKLKLCNPRLQFVLAKAYNLYGIYLLKQGVAANTEWNLDRDCTHICGMEAGISPEFTVLHKTKIKKPNKELFGNKPNKEATEWVTVDTYVDQTRGWRTILVRLLHAGLITRHDVETHFGWIPSQNSRKWSEQTR